MRFLLKKSCLGAFFCFKTDIFRNFAPKTCNKAHNEKKNKTLNDKQKTI